MEISRTNLALRNWRISFAKLYILTFLTKIFPSTILKIHQALKNAFNYVWVPAYCVIPPLNPPNCTWKFVYDSRPCFLAESQILFLPVCVSSSVINILLGKFHSSFHSCNHRAYNRFKKGIKQGRTCLWDWTWVVLLVFHEKENYFYSISLLCFVDQSDRRKRDKTNFSC